MASKLLKQGQNTAILERAPTSARAAKRMNLSEWASCVAFFILL